MRSADHETRDTAKPGAPIVQNGRLVMLRRFLRCDSGATAIEYGLICSMIFLVIVVAVQGVASQTVNLHTRIQNATN